ncbi:MAG: class I SAM-dependent methyltransferase [Simkaniaceae bacterium]|nr:class I SAM-dependent methyltransferase [Simkaniaceae bacterium]
MPSTSFEEVCNWYDKIVSGKGHYYHKEVVFPNLLKMLDLKAGDALLDLGCGQGVFSRVIPKKVDYCGVDLSKGLISEAKKRSPNAKFHVKDATKPFDLKSHFSHAVCILAAQNMNHFEGLVDNASNHLKVGGKFYLVLNHPCFRIPRQTHWGVDETKKMQYRRIESYMSEMEIPIQLNPGTTLSYHSPLSSYFTVLAQRGFATLRVEEWCSNKRSSGKMAKMENRARREIPLFLTIEAVCVESLDT